MPEILEVEMYRQAAATAIGRRIEAVLADERCLQVEVSELDLVASTIVGVRRRGKQLVLDTDRNGIGLHFGMAGRLVVDGDAPIAELVYGGRGDRPEWERFVLEFDDGGSLRVIDPRRWCRIGPDPGFTHLGPDAFDLTLDELAAALYGRRRALKAVLLDQQVVAGLGNLCIDEVLFQAGLAPGSAAGALGEDHIGVLHGVIGEQLPLLLARGGSHTGILSPAVRAAVPGCPLDGFALQRDRIGGRTTIWCPHHQQLVV